MKIRKHGKPGVIASPKGVIDTTLDKAIEMSKKEFIEVLKSVPNGKKKGVSVGFYQQLIYKIGGIEEWLWYMCTYFSDYNIIVYYEEGNMEQILRLAPYATIIKLEPNVNIDCDLLLINNYHRLSILEQKNVKPKKCYCMIHSDFRTTSKYETIHTCTNNKLNGYISVSKSAHDGLKEVLGIESKIIYNFVNEKVEENRNMVRFITLSRATREKGIHRIVKTAKEFNKKGKNFMWFICGTIDEQLDESTIRELKSIKEIIFLPPSIYNKELINVCDYVVQLSDSESFCFSLHQGLSRGVPAITTDYPEAREFIKDGVNGYIVDMKLNNLDVDKIFNEIPKGAKNIDKCNKKDWVNLFEGDVLNG